MVLEYNPIKLGNRSIKVRNWKVKDRELYKSKLKNISSTEDELKARYECFVTNVLETPTALNNDELEYLFLLLRIANLGDDLNYHWWCRSCEKTTDSKIKLSKLFTTKSGKIQDIDIGDIKIELQDVQNVELYNNKLRTSDSPSTDDLIFHIKSINDDNTKGFQDIKNYFDELDINTMDKISEAFEKMIFKIESREHTVTCSHCGANSTFNFDEIPDIIPPKWLKR
ncbi:hypothetical protein DFW84_09500 [Campylobacter coli]|nr:hypothetical protein [Campylobacter coli]EAJ2917362.1 hypothetical protein [Campylobacter coli]EAJ3379108.1 hypothetical protein [Campylobacter coli]EAJ3789432.1 hypothetical protein [Campylobacter coli]